MRDIFVYSTALQCGCYCSGSSCFAVYCATFLPSSQGKGNFIKYNSEQTNRYVARFQERAFLFHLQDDIPIKASPVPELSFLPPPPPPYRG